MKRRITSSIIFLIFLLTCFLSPSSRQAQASPSRLGDLIVNIREGTSIDDINSRHGTTTRQQILGTNFYELYAPQGRSVKKTRKRLNRDRDVISASINHLVATVFARSIMSFPDSRPEAGHTESDYRAQRQLVEKLRLDQSHRRSRGEGVVVAVIDTGVASDHPALEGHLYEDPYEIPDNRIDDDEDGFIDETRGWDFYDNDNDPTDEPGGSENSVAGHGTFIAGLIALMAPDCRILPIRAFNQDGNSSEFLVASAINYAVYQGAQIISLSCGTSEDASVLRDAIHHAREQGVIVVAAFGNEGTDAEPQYPANQEEVIGVAATDEDDRRIYFSNYGRGVSVSAPGFHLFAPFLDGGYAEWSGTSFAAPLAAAQAALIISADLDTSRTRSIMEESAISIDGVNPGYEGRLGKGRIDPLSALQAVNAGAILNLFAAVALSRSDDSLAQGEASVFIYGNSQYFALDASGLDPSRGYRLVVNGERLSSTELRDDLTANEFGGIRIVFSTDPSGDEHRLPDGLRPVTSIRSVELRDSEDRIILRNEFAPVTEFAPTGEFFQKEARIESTASFNAFGAARVEAASNLVRVTIEVERLADGVYELFADGRRLGVFAAEQGFLKAVLTSDGSEGVRIPPEARPAVNIRRVEVVSSGRVLASGEFAITSGAIGR